ncbi:hypothetical protein GIB67_004545, partial [Kingdonia uniflora]
MKSQSSPTALLDLLQTSPRSPLNVAAPPQTKQYVAVLSQKNLFTKSKSIEDFAQSRCCALLRFSQPSLVFLVIQSQQQ